MDQMETFLEFAAKETKIRRESISMHMNLFNQIQMSNYSKDYFPENVTI